MDSLLNTYLTLLKMSTNDPRYESMLFNYETTMRHDFRKVGNFGLKRTVYQEKPRCLRVRPPPLKDIQTLMDWKNPGVPIDMMVKPKDIVQTDPRKIQKAYHRHQFGGVLVPLEDLDKERVRSTRPRLVMTPAISMDDIDDEQKREILTKEIYKSSNKSAMVEGITQDHDQPGSVKARLQGTFTPANPITIEKLQCLQFPYVSPQWRMRSASWDGRQLRAHCDPSREFYLARPLRCKICEETAARARDRKMLKSKRNV